MKRKFSFGFAESRLRLREGVRTRIKSKNFWFNFFRVALILLAIGVLGIVFLFIWYSKDLPSPTKVVRREGYSSKVYDRNGNALYDIYDTAKREPVVAADIPDYLKKATISVEDKSFYTHSGVDLLTPLRIIKNFFYFGKVTGGSTLTQHLYS
jgi:membrane peptidoglycan carboxypeptidase